jgi:hypothetical protein
MIGLGIGVARRPSSGGGGSAFDVDAQAFFTRVETAGGTLSETEKNATNQLVLDMKSAGIWSSMKAVYPMVGSSAAACAQNLKSSSFTGTFSSGFTFASTGVTPNGTSAFMNTNYLLGSANGFSFNNMHFSHYSRTNSTSGTQVDMGAGLGVGTFNNLYQYISGNYGGTLMSKQLDVATANSLGFLIKTATSTINAKLYKNGSLTLTDTATQTATTDINVNCSIFAQNIQQFSTRECAFASIGDGLTDTQAASLYTCVQTMNTTLSRNV